MNTFDRLFPGRTGQAAKPLVWMIGFFAFINVYSIQAVLPLLVRDLQVSPSDAGLTVGATVLGIAVLSPFMGMLSDAWGRKVLLCTSLLALAVTTLLVGLVDSLPQVILCRFLQGLAVPGIVVSTMAYIAEECLSIGVARMTSVYVGGSVMGGYCGRLITGYSAEWIGWRGSFVVIAVLTVLGALAVLWRLPASQHFTPKRHVRGAFKTLAAHVCNPRLQAACAVGFCVLFALVGAFTYVNLHLAAPPFNLSSAGLANVFTIYLVGVVVTPLAGRFMDGFGLKPSMLLALVLSAVGFVLTLHPSLWGVLLGLTLGSCGVFICQSITLSFIGQHVSEGRSLAMGLYNTCYYAGGAVAAWAVGLAYEAWGWGGAVLSIALVQGLAAAITWKTWPRSAGRTVAH